MPVIEGLEQQTPEWLQMRVGMCTASKVVDVVTTLKRGGYSAARADYLMDVVVERLTGRATDHYVTQWMEAGTENEPLAKAAYEVARGVELQEGGFFIHPQIKWFGASPDALIGDDGLLECKCLKTSNHLAILQGGVIPVEYAPQLLAEMACAERKWVDFVSFSPFLPKHLRLFIRRMERDDALISAMEAEIEKFLGEVDAILARLEEFSR